MPKSYGQLVPSVERRLSAWVSLSDRHRRPEVSLDRPTVTISRRFGCEAFPLAERLKELLGTATGEAWNIYDKALLERVSQDERLSMTLLQDLGGPSRAIDSIGFLFAAHVPQDAIYRRVAKHLVHVAETGNAIIVGRGGAILTHKLPNCYHFRLDASFEFRVASLARRLEVPEHEAARMVREGDKSREKLIEDCLRASVSDVTYYDAVFNNERRSVAEIARAIVTIVAESWPKKDYIRIPLLG